MFPPSPNSPHRLPQTVVSNEPTNARASFVLHSPPSPLSLSLLVSRTSFFFAFLLVLLVLRDFPAQTSSQRQEKASTCSGNSLTHSLAHITPAQPNHTTTTSSNKLLQNQWRDLSIYTPPLSHSLKEIEPNLAWTRFVNSGFTSKEESEREKEKEYVCICICI